MSWSVICADVLEGLAALRPGSVQATVTSPPYYGLRDYGIPPTRWPDGWVGCLGLEPDPGMYLSHLVEVFRAVRRVMRDDGVLWLNIGSSYVASGRWGGGCYAGRHHVRGFGFRMPPPGFKMKDLALIPQMIAEALRDDGWYLRAEIVWSKGVAPEPPRLDRPSRSHEAVFLLSVSEHYQTVYSAEPWWLRSVWDIPAEQSVEHVATMPRELARRCISSCPDASLVLDPFAGSGTTGLVAIQHGRRFVGIERSPTCCAMARRRIGAADPEHVTAQPARMAEISGPLFAEPEP